MQHPSRGVLQNQEKIARTSYLSLKCRIWNAHRHPALLREIVANIGRPDSVVKFTLPCSNTSNAAPMNYRNTASTLSQSDVALSSLSVPSFSVSSVSDDESDGAAVLDSDGCVALTGSDAGKLSISPASSLACIS